MRVIRRVAVVALLLSGVQTARAQRAEPEPVPADAEGSAAEPPKEPEPPPTTGTIEGTVEAQDRDAPLAGATVTIVGTRTSATTDDRSRPAGANRFASVCLPVSLRVVVKGS